MGNIGRAPRGDQSTGVTWQRGSGERPRVVAIYQLSWNYFKILRTSVVKMASTGVCV